MIDPPMLLWYDRPASEWLEALPVGNGRLAAMVFGGTGEERLQLNEGTVWGGGPHDYDNPEAGESLAEVRRLVFRGEWHQAQEMVNAKLLGRPARQSPYQPIGDLLLAFGDGSGAAQDYRREIDLSTAIASVSYRAGSPHAPGAAAQLTREVFASYPDQVIVVRLTADAPGRVGFTARLSTPQAAAISAEAGNTLVLSGISGDWDDGMPGQVRFQALVRVLPEGGALATDGGRIVLSRADAATILISIGSSYRSYHNVGGDPAAIARGHLERAAAKSYLELRRAHLADYAPLFSRLHLDLGESAAGASELPTDRRIASFARDNDPALAALYCQYGRYLTIAASRPGGLPSTLQGLWNELMEPPWGSKYTVNINTQMNYWLPGPANLPECMEPLLDFLEQMTQAGRVTACSYYGARGWMCHNNTNAFLGTAVVDGAFWAMWPTGGAWLCRAIWDHFEFTGDLDALRRRYPVLRGASEFFLDALVQHPDHPEWLVTCPSVSPENGHHPDCSICAGPTMDSSILRDLFEWTARSAELLGIDGELRGRVLAARERLPWFQIGAQGQLQEWLDDWDAGAPEQDHRHVSHLYGLYPSEQITQEHTPDLIRAAENSLLRRGDESTGWAMAWRINLWARLHDGEHAYKLVAGLLSPERTAPNGFDLHPPFQIDGNYGGASGILEMLLQSHAGELHLLPALPEAWKTGSVQGVGARGGFAVDLAWSDGRLTSATILSAKGGLCHVRCGERAVTFTVSAGQPFSVPLELVA